MRVPRPLGWLLVVVAVFGVAWALLVPAWQTPDAFAHFAYVESIAARHALPGSGTHESSSSVRASDEAIGAHRISFWPVARPSWDAAADRAYRTTSARLSRSDGAGPNIEQPNPPLYYAFALPAYLATVGGDDLDRLYSVRLWGVLLVLATVVGAWLLAGEVLGRRRTAQLACAAVVGLEPMQGFVSTAVMPDALLVPLWTFALWLGVRVIKRAAPRDVIALGAVTGAAVVTKAASYALVPAVLLALVAGWLRTAPTDRSARRQSFAVGMAALLAPTLGWLYWARATGRSYYNPVTASSEPGHPQSVGELLGYIWQFYLPRLPFMSVRRPTSGLPLWEVWIREGWGTFGWIDVPLPPVVYPVLATLTGAVAVAGAAILVRVRDRLSWVLAAFFGLAGLGLLAGIHLTEYRFLKSGGGPFSQGRYALPVIGLFGVAVGLILTRMSPRARGLTCALVLVGLLTLQIVALAAVAKAYYT